MKKQSLSQSMSWLHTWGGLVFGWLLFAIFLTGTLAVFDKEIDVWMRAELPAHRISQGEALQRALAYLEARHPQAERWNIGLPSERAPSLSVSTGEPRRGGGEQLDPRSGEPLAVRETAGGGFFFRFHFTLDLPRNIGIWLVGLAAMVMLAALVSGILIHKKFFKEFFTFRPGKGQRSWLDGHNASAVLLLPFHLMITYTGLVIFFLIYMPAAVDALYGDREAFGRAMRGAPAEQQGGAPEARGERREPGQISGRGERPRTAPAPLADLAPILAEAERQMGPLSGLSIENPGRRDARIEVRPILGNRIELTKGRSMLFDGVSGELLRAPAESRPSQLTQRVMAGLHFAQFGGYPMRWLYFLCGLVSSAMIATGLVLFCVKRRRKYASETPAVQRFHRLIEALNLTVVAGLSLACIAMLWANRLLPAALEQRAVWEVNAFFAMWSLSLLHALWRPTLRGWSEQLGLVAVLCLALPLLSLATLPEPWAQPLRQALELTSLALGVALGWLAWRVYRRQEVGSPQRGRAAVMREAL